MLFQLFQFTSKWIDDECCFSVSCNAISSAGWILGTVLLSMALYGIIWHSFCHEHENVISAKHLMLRILTASSSPTDANMIYIYIELYI